MEVSTFELLFKPQAPAAAAGVAVDRVIQGYFLTITNLEDQTYRYRVEFVITPPPATAPNQAFRSLASNTLVFVDTGGSDNQPGVLAGTLASSTFAPSTGNIIIPPRGTALLAVLPTVFPSDIDMTPIAMPVFEVRGYVRISLPALLKTNPLRFEAQSDAPVRVLLTPQQRATFLSATNVITGQVQASLPTASGGASTTITPNPGGPLIIVTTTPLIERVGIALEMLASLPDEDRVAILMGAMSQVDSKPETLRALNDMLAGFDISLGVERRKRMA